MELIRTRVLICAEQEPVRRGLRALMESDPSIEVVGDAGSPDATVQAAAALEPDVVVMDVRMLGQSGIEASRDIRARRPATKVIVLASFADDESLFSAVMAGASGCVLKQIHGAELMDALHSIARDRSLTPSSAASPVRARIHAERDPGGSNPFAALTPEEHEVIDLIVDGLTNRQIGERMRLGEQRVKDDVSSIVMKLGVSA